MNASRNNGYWQDKEMFPFKVEGGTPGTLSHSFHYISSLMSCTCRAINCHHVQAVRDMVQGEKADAI